MVARKSLKVNDFVLKNQPLIYLFYDVSYNRAIVSEFGGANNQNCFDVRIFSVIN